VKASLAAIQSVVASRTLSLDGSLATPLASHGNSIDGFSRERRATEDDLRLTLRFAATSRPFCFHRLGGQFDINGSGRITYSTFTIVSAPRSTTARKA